MEDKFESFVSKFTGTMFVIMLMLLTILVSYQITVWNGWTM